MTRLIAAITIAIGALLSSTGVASAEPTCYEDMACWDPGTMGNHQGTLPDGQVPIPGDYTVVS
jgi:hypothetical protein